MFMKNCWQVAAYGREVVAGHLFPRRICGDAVVFYRAKDGRVIALEDRCAHSGHANRSQKQQGFAHLASPRLQIKYSRNFRACSAAATLHRRLTDY